MAIKETLKLKQLARYSQEEFLPRGSLLNQTRLSRFIVIALLLHISVVIFQSLIIVKPKDPLIIPPIKVKYVATKKPEPVEQKRRLLNASKPIKVKKQEDISSKQKIYRQTKILTPKTNIKSNASQHTQAQLKFKKIPASQKQKSIKNNRSLQPLVKKTNGFNDFGKFLVH